MLFTERTIRTISGDLKSRIDTCQKDCASLKDRFSIRVHVDTNIQVKEMKFDMGTYLLLCLFMPFSNLFAANIGRMVDDELGASEFCILLLIDYNLFNLPSERYSPVAGRT